MTAPAVASPAPAAVAAPASATPLATPVSAPVVETPVVVEDKKPESMQSIADRIIRKVTPESLAEPAEVVTVPDDKAAALTAAVESQTPAQAAVEGLAPAQVLEIKADEPDGEVLLRSRDADGRFTQMDQAKLYELAIKDKQTGETKVYTKTLPELMRMAKDGVTMQRSRDELAYYRTQTPQWQQTHQQLTQRIQTAEQKVAQYEALTHGLLTDPAEVVDRQRETYAQQFTPERRIQQLEAQLAQRNAPAPTPQQVQQQQQPAQDPQVAQQIASFGQRIGPIVAEVEGMVGKEAAAGHIALVTLPLMVNGRIPPERLADVEQYMQGPYREWAKAEAAKQNAAKTELEAARQERTRAQKAAQSVGTATRPAGGSPSTAPVTQAKPRTVQEAITKAITRPIAAAAPG